MEDELALACEAGKGAPSLDAPRWQEEETVHALSPMDQEDKVQAKKPCLVQSGKPAGAGGKVEKAAMRAAPLGGDSGGGSEAAAESQREHRPGRTAHQDDTYKQETPYQNTAGHHDELTRRENIHQDRKPRTQRRNLHPRPGKPAGAEAEVDKAAMSAAPTHGHSNVDDAFDQATREIDGPN